MKSVLKFFAAALILSLALAALVERPGLAEAEWLGYRATTTVAFLLPLFVFWSWLMVRLGAFLRRPRPPPPPPPPSLDKPK